MSLIPNNISNKRSFNLLFMKILITGGAGFIGNHLVDALLRKKHKVIVISHDKKQNKQKGVKFYQANICSSKIDLIFKKELPDIVYHLAAILPTKNTSLLMKTNIMGSVNILEMAQKYKIKKIIFASSAAVYGNPQTSVIKENHPTDPLSIYGLSKLTVEKLFKIYCNLYKIPYIIIRYGNIYGPGQKTFRPGSVIVNFIYKILHNQIPEINGNGKQLRDYIYIDDLIDASLKIIKIKKVGVYNVGSGVGISLNDIISKINKILNKNIKPKYNLSAKSGVAKSILDIKKIKKELRWKPKVQLETGLKNTINYFKCL